MIHGRTGDTVAFGLAESQARNAVMAARQVLRTVHFVEERGNLRNLLDANNAKSPQAFLEDLRRLAQVGWMLWTALFADKLDTVDTIQSSLLASRRLQICMAGPVDLVFPWAMIYDIPLFGGNDEQRPCRLVEEWTGSSPMVAHDTADCPFADTHGQNVLCPYGFWGMRHVIEQPPSVPDGSSLSLEIALLAEPGKVLAGFSPALNDRLTQAHIDALVTALGTRLQLAPCFTIATLRDALAATELPLAYLYCHGVRSSLAGTTGSIPELVLDKDSSLRPQDLIGLRMSVWPSNHWRVVRPLVFINGCHTAELTPEELVSFVGAFVNVGAAGVVGTEITLHQSVAGEAAEAFLTAFASGADVGSAMSALRRQLLGKGNLLGLAYTPYCSSGLSLRSLVSDSVEGGEGA